MSRVYHFTDPFVCCAWRHLTKRSNGIVGSQYAETVIPVLVTPVVGGTTDDPGGSPFVPIPLPVPPVAFEVCDPVCEDGVAKDDDEDCAADCMSCDEADTAAPPAGNCTGIGFCESPFTVTTVVAEVCVEPSELAQTMPYSVERVSGVVDALPFIPLLNTALPGP